MSKSKMGSSRKFLEKSDAPWARLAAWFERQKRVLPWRDEPSLYRVWISEIMLQQTQVVTVVPYFERFTARFPDVRTLAESSEEEVLLHWAGLGYYSRARNLRKGAQQVVASGGFPTTREGWEAIPGVGPYTAGAILSIALDQPEAILDGNVERVLSRVGRVDREAGDGAFKEKLWTLSREMVSRGHQDGVRPSVLNQAMMELGAMVCSPRKTKCEACPLASDCQAHARGDQESFPPRKKPKEWLAVREELHCLLDGKGRMLLRRRAAGEWRAGLWDLLEKEPHASVCLGSIESRHVVTRHKITRVTHVWKAAEELADETETLRWVSIDEPEVAVGSALKKSLGKIGEF